MEIKEINRIVDEFRVGDYRHFKEFYEETKRHIFFVTLPIVKNQQDSEDILQETYVKFIQSLDSFKPNTNPYTYLSTIARNLSINLFNKKKREVYSEELISTFAKDYSQDSSFEQVLEMIKDLKQIEQEIIILHIVDDFKFREIASILNKGLSFVLVTYNRAIKKLRKGAQQYEK